jgi:hypothetical protein
MYTHTYKLIICKVYLQNNCYYYANILHKNITQHKFQYVVDLNIKRFMASFLHCLHIKFNLNSFLLWFLQTIKTKQVSQQERESFIEYHSSNLCYDMLQDEHGKCLQNLLGGLYFVLVLSFCCALVFTTFLKECNFQVKIWTHYEG